MIDETMDAAMLEEALELSNKLAKELLTPIAMCYAGETAREVELLATAYMAAILSCAATLEQIYGEKLTNYVERAKRQAEELMNATFH